MENFMERLILEQLIVDAYIKRHPLICTIELTTMCNFRCVHCYVGEKNSPIFLAKDKVISFIDAVTKQGCLYIVLTGGDPLLHPDFPYIYQYARSKCNVIVFTNGYALTDKIFNLFTAFPPSCIEITLYGATEETYYKTVGIHAYSKVMDAIKKLVAHNIHLKLKSFLVKENFEEWSKIQSIAKELDVEFKFDSFVIAPKESQEYCHQISQVSQNIILEKNGTKPHTSNQLSSLINSRGTNKMYKCGAGMYSVWLRANNTLNMCAFSDIKKGISLESVSFPEAWKKLEVEANTDIPENMRCRNCSNIDKCLICPTKYAVINGQNSQYRIQLCAFAEERSE